MRRMTTNKQVVEVVNKAIEDGDIEVLPVIEQGDAGKVLKVNEQEDGVEWGEAGGGAGSLYRHDIVIFTSNYTMGTTSLYTSTNAAINSVALLQSYLSTNGYNSSTNVLTISNCNWMDADTGDTVVGFGIYNDEGTIMLGNFSPNIGEGAAISLDAKTIRDTVVAL